MFFFSIICCGLFCFTSCEKENNPLANTRWESNVYVRVELETVRYTNILEFYKNGRVVQEFNGNQHVGTYRVKDGAITFDLSGQGIVVEMFEVWGRAHEALYDYQNGTYDLTNIIAKVKILEIVDIYTSEEAKKRLIGETFDLTYEKVTME